MEKKLVLMMAMVWTAAASFASNGSAETPAAAPRTLRVPADHATIQAAIDAAHEGDTVLVTPGVYRESLRLAGKSVRLVSEFDASRNKDAVQNSVLDGRYTDADGNEKIRDQVILVEADAGPATEIVGFTIRNGDDGISCQADVRIAHNYFTANDDAIDYEGGGGICEFNKFERNTDDAVDYDLDCDATVRHNEIIDNDDDGIEIRLHDYRGPTLHLVIHDNIITGNGEDGIQIIDYPGLSDRRIRIERNLIARNAMAGIGCMSDAITAEDYRGADIPEPIEVVGNTIADNEYGITGGDRLVAINNIVAGHKQIGMKKVDAQSVAAHNLFWANGTDFVESNVEPEHTREQDPRLDANYRPQAGSPCIDAGVATWRGESAQIAIGDDQYRGAAPDLGAFEFNSEAVE